MCFKYRRDIDWRVTIPPTRIYSVVTFIVTGLVGSTDLHVLIIIFAIFLMALWPFIAAGSVCILIGMKLGEMVAAKLDPARLRVNVYSFVGISGLILLLQQL